MYLLLRCIICLSVLVGCHLSKSHDVTHGEMEYKRLSVKDTVYQVLKCKPDTKIHIDGKLESSWEAAIVHTNFKDHWYDQQKGETKFRSLWDESWLYFIYEVEDEDIVLEQTYADIESNAVRSDRIELFFSTNETDSLYYAFEIDADARLFDSKGKFKSYIDTDWDFPTEDIFLASTKNESGYRVEGKFSISRLKALDVLKNNLELKAGLFRGDYTTNEDNICWISWGKSSSVKPNFHLPSALRKLKLIKTTNH